MKKILFLLILFFLSGCQFVGTLLNAGHKAYNILADDRQISDDLSDIQINLNVRESLARQIPTLAIDVEVTVFEGEVLLTGAIPNTDVIHTILTATWSVPGVRKVYNYIRLNSAQDIQDISLETAKAMQIKAELAVTAGIESANYKLILENGTVYLMGICSSEAEYQAVLAVLKNTDGVEQIVPLMRQTLED